ncbi:TonB-dependent receptor [Aurantiacibacter marinus]|uniref:TonB-dependent receptor n=1 Tax=Aurantiacibacter marinus TaxID=874156 RepID=A0A0H0XQB1_9SPHN|nr:TonB-dependent receptor [Aurantiacibacter marinus]KLI64132.1 TonB-dependent receptor [Aurantiacibacter marinus]
MRKTIKSALCTAASTAVASALLLVSNQALAQSTDDQDSTSPDNDTNVIIVSGILGSLASALEEERRADNIVEVIRAEDIGKLPDQNLAEVLENITGVQIDRSAGVGTSVQIRGTGANRVEINGVSTVGAGNGRSGISFEDLPAALIAAVEVTKVSEASTIEGSVGGTINLRTIRPLDLRGPLISVRAQGEYSDLSDTISPRISATVGNNWDTGAGEIGLVLSASYAELDVTQFSPRVDRDRAVLPNSGLASAESFPFLRIQFLDQQLTNQEYETLNFTGSVEWKPTDNLRLYVDATINDQSRIQQSSRAFFSGTTATPVINNTDNTSFETVDLGTVDGPNGPLVLGEVQAVTSGVLGVGVAGNGSIDANLRMGTQTGSRLTESSVLAAGFEWNFDRLTANVELSRSKSVTDLPNLSSEIDFINPRGPQPSLGRSSDNGVPAIFDTRDGILQFGIAPGLAESPTSADLLNPANYRLRGLGQGASSNDNQEDAFRVDLNFDTVGVLPLFSSIDAGWRHNVSSAVNLDSTLSSNFTATSSPSFFRPSLDQFSQFVVAGPNNFNAADSRTLFIPDYLQIDPVASVTDRAGLITAINAAISENNQANNVSLPLIGEPTQTLTAFFDIEEKTNALYVQGNYDFDVGNIPIRGNLGVRWVQTDINSTGNNVINGVVEGQLNQSSSYDFLLPRWSFVAEPAADLLIRAGISRDLRRPNFDDLSISVAFSGSATAPVTIGNPDLQPETVWSYDLAGEYYFSDTGLISVGVFHKRRTNLFARETAFPTETTGAGGQIERDITPPCEGGGIFNPFADRNVFSSIQGQGLCVPVASTINSSGVATQTGVEVAFQYDLSRFENTLGFASGFGFIGNFTYQEDGGDVSNFYNGSGGGNALNQLLGRTDTNQSTQTLDDDVVFQRITLPNLSNYAYNATLFYDKYGINFRARYTWRSDFVIQETQRFGLPRVVDDRGQLNASLSYAITDRLSVGIDGINLLREDRNEWCINDDALLCEQGLTDRRFVAGVSFQF